MTEKNSPAFPKQMFESKNGEQYYGQNGLTIREYFAVMAMQGLCANHEWAKTIQDDWIDYKERLTSGSVELADALIESLNK